MSESVSHNGPTPLGRGADYDSPNASSSAPYRTPEEYEMENPGSDMFSPHPRRTSENDPEYTLENHSVSRDSIVPSSGRIAPGEKRPDMEKKLEADSELDLYGWCCIPVYNPHAVTVDSYWDLIMLNALFFVAIVTPFEISFLSDDSNVVLWWVNRLLDVIFICDMFLSFNTCYKDEETGDLVFSRWRIALNYFKGYFFIDFISLVPIVGVVMTLLNSGVETRFLQILRIVRLLRLTKIVQLVRKSKTFSYIESRYPINYSLVQLYLFLFGLFYMAHFLACGWHLVLLLEDNRECVIFTTWVESQACCYNWWTCFGPINLYNSVGDPESPVRKYFIALEWAMGEMLTVGSDISAVTDVERTYQLVVHVIAGLVYAYLIGTVVAIFDAMTASHKEFFTKMDHLNTALAMHNVNEDNPELACCLRTFYRFRNTFFEMDSCLQEVFHNLTPHLRSRLKQQVYEQQVMCLELFRGCEVSEEMVADLSVHMSALPFGPNERLLHLDGKADHFFFLQMGVVLSQARVHSRGRGTVVGSDAIFAPRDGCERGYDAITMTHGIVNRMYVSDLVTVLNSARYKHSACTKVVHWRLIQGRMMWILREFTRAFKKGAKNKTYTLGVSVCIRELTEICKTTQQLTGETLFKTCDHLFFEYWCKTHPDQRKPLTALRNSIKMKNSVRHFLKTRRMIKERNELEGALKPFGLASMVEKIYVSEKLDLSALRTLSLIELHAVGFPMGTAKKFHLACHNGDVHLLSHAVMSPSPSMATLKGGGDEKPAKKGAIRMRG